MRRTKIVCTIGPASESPEMLRALLEAGMNVARLNASHGRVSNTGNGWRCLGGLRKRWAALWPSCWTCRGRKSERAAWLLRKGWSAARPGLYLHSGAYSGTSRRVSVDYPDLPRIIEPGDTIYLDDGSIELRVQKREGRRRPVPEWWWAAR